MFLILLRRELLTNLMAFRFFVTTFVCLLLVIANSIVLIEDYENRLKAYNVAVQVHRDKAINAPTYSYIESTVDRPPNPLSIFNQGFDRRLGNKIETYRNVVPTLWDAELHGSDNPFLNLLSSIDLVFIFQVVLSLLASLFAYDAIAGEREGGTLRLMMTTSVSRGKIILAKYISAMGCLVIPFLASLALAQILFVVSGSLFFSVNDWIRIGGIFATTIVYLSAFYLIGLLISVVFQRTSTALIFSMFIWVVLVLIYPSLSVSLVDQFFQPQEKLKAATKTVSEIWKRVEGEEDRYIGSDPILSGYIGEKHEWIFYLATRGWGMNNYKSRYVERPERLLYYRIEGIWCPLLPVEKESEKHTLPALKSYYKYIESMRMRAAEQTGLIRQKTYRDTYVREANMATNLMRCSPAAMYDLATQAWAGTNLREIQNFFAQARQYRQTLIAYLHDKKAFTSPKWFTVGGGKADLNDLPHFSYHHSGVWFNVKHALPDLALLFLINIPLFMMSFLIFVKQDV